MEVFIPHKKDFNIYFEEIIFFSDNNYIYGNLNEYQEKYDIVNIQFPEAIFNWLPPSKSQLQELENKIVSWKKKSKLIYTLNDLKSHYDREGNFISLFNLIQQYADGVVHLGSFSFKSYKNLFQKNCKHKIIYHALYNSLLKLETTSIEEKFNLEFKNKYVVSVIGNVRSIEEVKFIFKIFKKIKNKSKLLIVPKMFNFFKLPKRFPYRFRKMYWFLVKRYYTFPLKKKQYFFSFNYVDYSLMVNLVKKSDLIIIPRLKNLNSGILYLGLTFNKPMLIPGIGNLTEVANYLNLPYLDLESKNYKEVLKCLTSNNIKEKLLSKAYLEKREAFQPKKIAKEYDNFFKSIIQK